MHSYRSVCGLLCMHTNENVFLEERNFNWSGNEKNVSRVVHEDNLQKDKNWQAGRATNNHVGNVMVCITIVLPKKRNINSFPVLFKYAVSMFVLNFFSLSLIWKFI